MTSSMFSGDRRWKRGTLTPIGKIVVPKPINLPSQRLENHGLDPSVEIVPKGTLSWGSKSSSATNAWGSSLLSPTDGGTGSPSHLSGRPSSGSGTRPSTASSDRIHESITNTSGPNSRPSSASGALATNQTSLTSLRPRSAETRPGSSQLSRFAEPSEHPVAWSATGTAEKLGVTPPKNDGFSLTSGDFPTLGSVKESTGKNADPQDQRSHGRPGSSSGGGTTKERIGTSVAGDVSVNANAKSGTVNSWKRDNPPCSDDEGRPGMEKWQGNPQPYPNANVPPHHYDAWHGAPLNNPQGGVWFRGPPGGPPGGPSGGPPGGPYGNAVAPGGFPMEPYPYYRPQIPAAGLANPQPVPPPVGGPRGHHPLNGDMYRPHMPDAYMRPGMPIRPGFYHGPVPFEGYYNHPMGYCSSSERDVQFMGMAAGPTVYNRYPGQNIPEPGNAHGRSSGHGPTNQTLIAEQVESGHPQDTRGPYKVLLKQHDGDRKNEEQRSEGSVTGNTSYLERGDQPMASSWENNWRPDHRKDGERNLRKPALGEEASSQTFDDQGTSNPVQVKSHGSVGNMKPLDDISVKNWETESLGLSKTHPLPAGPKGSSLMQKIEGLNAKARTSDVRNDGTSISSGDRQLNKLQGNPKANQTETDTNESGISRGDKNLEAIAGVGSSNSRRSTHVIQGKGDYHGRGRLNTQEGDSWQKKSSIADSTAVISASHLETSVQAHHTLAEATEKTGLYPHGRGEGESVPQVLDSNDSQAQRAKMRELAKQRTRQLQEEEEERTRKQMAKAQAKLEELNRRTNAVEGSTQKSENAPSAIQSKQEESQTSGETLIAGRRYGPTKSALGSKPNTVVEINEGSASRVEKPPISSSEQPLEAPKSSRREHVLMHEQSVPLQQDPGAHDAHHKISLQVHESNFSKPRHTGFKQKQTSPPEKISSEKAVSATVTINEAPRNQPDAADKGTISLGVAANEVVSTGESSLPVNSNANDDSSGYPRKKNNRNGKNKLKIDDASQVAVLPSSASKENIANTSVDDVKPKAAEFGLDPSSVRPLTISKDADQSSGQHSPLLNEETHGRVNNQWKPQQSRRMPRNPPVNRSTEKSHGSDAVVWARVRSQGKTEVPDEASPKNVVEAVSVSVKSDQIHNNSKNKRAEMERYVPKPVAKEMAQQGSSHQPAAATINQTATDETTVKADIGSQGVESFQSAGVAGGKAGYATESRNGNGRQNKQGKAHGSWRQRVSAESTSMQGLQDGPTNASNQGLHVHKSNEYPQRPDIGSVKEQPKSYDEWDTSDGWGISNASNIVEPASVSVTKDQGIIARGKRHAYKGHKSMGNNHDLVQKKNYGGDIDKIDAQPSASEVNQTELPAASKENRGTGDRSMSHWQPKSQAFSASNQRGNKHNGGQIVGTEINRTSKKESSNQDGMLPPMHKDTSESVGQRQRDQSISERNNADETPNLGQTEAKRERKLAPRGRPHSPNQGPPNQGPLNQVEPAPVGLDARQEQQMSSGFRRSGNQNSRFGRGHESRGDWNYSGQDNSQHNPPANRERQRHNSHYEYQPVGPYNKFSNSEGPKDGTHHNTGARVRDRERGQSHSRRGGGNFYGRQSGNV